MLGLGLCLACGGVAQADDDVRLWETKDLRPGLCTALRIQLADVSDVRCEPDPSAKLPLSERIARAAVQATRERDALVVLLERDPDPTRVRMFLVAGREDEAVVAIEQIENRPEPDVDRSLALKVRDSVDAVRRYKAVAATTSPPLAVVVAPRPVAPPEQATKLAWHLALEAGGAAVLGAQNRGAAVLGAGAGFDGSRLHFSMLANARLVSETQQKDAFGKVNENEWGVGVSLRAGVAFSLIKLGLSVDPQLTFASARGTTASGSKGTGDVQTVSSILAMDLRARLTAQLWLRVAPGLEVFAVKQRFALDDHVTLDTGRARAFLPLTLLFELPLRQR